MGTTDQPAHAHPEQWVPVPGPGDDTNGILIVLWRPVDPVEVMVIDPEPENGGPYAADGYQVAGAYRVDDADRAKRLAMHDRALEDYAAIDRAASNSGLHLQVVLARNWCREPKTTRWTRQLEIG